MRELSESHKIRKVFRCIFEKSFQQMDSLSNETAPKLHETKTCPENTLRMAEKEIDPLREEFGKLDSDSTDKVIPWLKEVSEVIPHACKILKGSFEGSGNSIKYVRTIKNIKNLYHQAARFQHYKDVIALTNFLEMFVREMNRSMDFVTLCDMIKLMRSRFCDIQNLNNELYKNKMLSWNALYRSYSIHIREVQKMLYLWPDIRPKIDEIDLHVELLVKLYEVFHRRREPEVMTVVSSMYDILIMKSGVCTVENLKDWLSKLSCILRYEELVDVELFHYCCGSSDWDAEAPLILNDKEDIKTGGFTMQLIEAINSLRNAQRDARRQLSTGWSVAGIGTWCERVNMLEYRVQLIISIHNSRNSLDLLCPDFLPIVKRTTLFCEIQVKLFYGEALDIFHSPVPSNSTQREVLVGQIFTGIRKVIHRGNLIQNNYLPSSAKQKRKRTNEIQESDGTKNGKQGKDKKARKERLED